MIAYHEGIRNELEFRSLSLKETAIENARWIEDVLGRAYQIHRQHGGIFGYDLEDWLQAERELAEVHSALDQERDSGPVEANISH